ncbi:hypothetical protein [Bacillus tropicus]|uniref:hypothetical protein n=1 Tax=Bacillus tropicus TaxID=2026188 RepID=UPI0021CEA206|nr:hypothetical protein [Bacillus tropicus]MCU5224083.1 hypothetical protein [Bacillus tropicus]
MKGSTKYQLLRDDFDHATNQLKLYRKEIDDLRNSLKKSNAHNKNLENENEKLLSELAKCRELLLPLMDGHKDQDDLFLLTVNDPHEISSLCKRVVEVFFNKE